MLKTIGILIAGFVIVSMFILANEAQEPTKASESRFNDSSIYASYTSHNLSKADLAWHALNSYGWDCAEVVSVGEMISGTYFYIDCSNGKRLRVYLRAGQHPKITNQSGGYN